MGRISKHRRSVWRAWRPTLLLLAGASGLFGCQGQAPESPNLVLISVDRLATDRLGCFDGEADAGGSICALGTGGTLFAWAVASDRAEASGVATILTGRPEAMHAVTGDGQTFLADHQPSIAEDLSGAGYTTAAFVASPRVNRSRRLDQGFDLYDDRLGSPSRSGGGGSVELSDAVHSWIETAPEPWFVWIHADRDDGLVELDRLLSRLSQTFASDRDGPGILFVALRGEAEASKPSSSRSRADAASASDAPASITWRSHRVPLVWRPPASDTRPVSSVSFRLASLIDVAPTLRAAARVSDAEAKSTDATRPPDPPTSALRSRPAPGHDLGGSPEPRRGDPSPEPRYVIVDSALPGSEVGLASARHLYVRHPSSLDGTGRAVPTEQLRALEARFASLPEPDRDSDAALARAHLDPPRWRRDVLDSDSPVPQLEFHLARGLGTLDSARRIGVRREPKEHQ